MKLNLGCGENILKGWENCDLLGPIITDLRQPLIYQDSSIEYILAEHCIEHLTCQEAYKLLHECYRVLHLNGVLRVLVPSPTRFKRCATQTDLDTLCELNHDAPTMQAAIKNILIGYGHQSWWTTQLLECILNNIGFYTIQSTPMISIHPTLNQIDGHWREVGKSIYEAETIVMEGTKLNNL